MNAAEVRRVKRLPQMLADARRKVEALEREAERYGFTDLLKSNALTAAAEKAGRPVVRP